MKKPKYQTPAGMYDILAEEWEYYEKIYNVALLNFMVLVKLKLLF